MLARNRRPEGLDDSSRREKPDHADNVGSEGFPVMGYLNWGCNIMNEVHVWKKQREGVEI
jgi:hypothetical protein